MEKELGNFSNDALKFLKYEITDGEVSITGYRGEPIDIVIPSEIKGKPVTSIGRNAFYNYKTIKEVHISSIETWLNISFLGPNSNPLCNGAKLYLNNEIVENLVIPDGITEIKDNTFSNCNSLKSITLPDSVISIGDDAFKNCGNLESVIIPDSVISIGSGAFEGCWSLKKITIPNSVTSFGETAFMDCGSLESFVIPDSTTTIVYGMFENCESLQSITIPDSVTEIEYNAFKNCSSLKSITIPDSVTSIYEEAFYESGYYFDESNWEDGVLYIGKHLICANEDIDYDYTIKNGTKTIAGGAFSPEDGGLELDIESITIPDSLICIGNSAFSNCDSLETVNYAGTQEQWDKINIDDGNEPLTSATINFKQ